MTLSGPPVALAVVIPAGPSDDVVDTVRSVLHYTSSPRTVAVVDDTGTGGRTRADLERLSPDVKVVPAPAGAPGGYGGLWVKIAAGYKYVARTCDFAVLLRLDADALMIGAGLAAAAAGYFESHPGVGMLGSYRTGPDGRDRDWSPAARLLGRECGWRGLDRPLMRRTLRQLRANASNQGYIYGEHPLGGAYLHSRAAVLALAERGWLDLKTLARSHLGEDHIFALITRAAGYNIADFGGPDGPLALKWRGLPAAPGDLLGRGKLVTHSVRSWESMGEAEVRRTFAAARRSAVHHAV